MSSVAKVQKTDQGLAFEGVVDHQSVPSLLSKLPEIEFDSPEIDLSKVHRIDSAGLAFLIDWRNKNLNKDQKINLRGETNQTAKLIEIMGLETVFVLT